MKTLLQDTEKLLEILDATEEPLGVYYSDEKPNGLGPKESPRLSRQAEESGELDLKAVWSSFSCVMGRMLLARKKKVATWLAADALVPENARSGSGFVFENGFMEQVPKTYRSKSRALGSTESRSSGRVKKDALLFGLGR